MQPKAKVWSVICGMVSDNAEVHSFYVSTAWECVWGTVGYSDSTLCNSQTNTDKNQAFFIGCQSTHFKSNSCQILAEKLEL